MPPEFHDLAPFYASRPGQLARRLIGLAIRQAWPDATGKRILGFGHAAPYLGVFAEEAERVCALTPRGHGLLRYPAEGRSRVSVCDEREWPVPDRMFDGVMLVHALETSNRPDKLLREAWRVLADGGRLLVVVPNRTGLWCLRESNPFGHGRPYSVLQIERRLREVLFEPVDSTGALFVPPIRSTVLMSTAAAWERVGRRYSPVLGGVLLVEAEKRIFGGNLMAFEPARARRYAMIGRRRYAAARTRHPEERARSGQR